MIKFFLMIFPTTIIMAIIVFIIICILDKKREQKLKQAREEIVSKYKAPQNYDSNAASCIDGGNLFVEGRIYGVWKKANDLCFLNRVILNCENYNYYEIPIKDIQYYRCYGDEHYYSKVSGGGGGGTSLGGAVIGGVLAGTTGAIIGSRKESDPIQTTVKHINSKETYLVFRYVGRNTTVSFYGDNLYRKLFKLIPDKAYENIALKSNYAQTSYDNNLDRLKDLKVMLDNDLITQFEYEEKKKEILSEI